MGAYDDIEPGSQSPPRSPMLGRSKTDARRKLTFIILLGGLLLVALLGFRRHDEIGEIIETQKQHYWKASSDGVNNETTETSASGKSKNGEKSGTLVSDTSSSGDEIVRFGFGKGKKGGKKGSKVEEKVEEESAGNVTEKMAPGPTFKERYLHDESLRQLRNDSLGFGNVYVLNMAGRSDKLDQMRLAASLTNFTFEVLPGVSGKDVPANALPGDFTAGREANDKAYGVIGCWRGHLNFANKVLENRLSSALVMEDDADWDVNFRKQLEYVALGSQALVNTDSDSVPVSPYGDGWDLLWLGHCASQPDDGDNRRVLLKNDKTVPPPDHRVNWGGIPDMWPRYENTTRIMYFSKGSTCTYAYAISFRGAQKIIKYLSTESYNKPVDFGLHDMCSDKKRGFRCIGMFPQIIGDHKPAGGADKDSDIGGGKHDDVRLKGFTYNVVHSTRLNFAKLIDGRREDAKSQWPGEMEKVEGEIELEWREDEVADTSD